MNLTLIASFGDKITAWFQGWFGALLSFIPKIIYQLLTPFWAILDAMQWIMRKLAGLDTIASFEGSQDFSGDLVSYFMNAIFSGNSPVLSNIFWSMIILGALMLIITTFIAVIKSEYTATDAKSASKGKIVASAFKAIASFAIVPIVCFFGIFLCNIILQAVDKVSTAPNSIDQEYAGKFKAETAKDANGNQIGEPTYYNFSFFGVQVPTNNTPISGIVFRAAAYNANRARVQGDFYQAMEDNPGVNAGGAFMIKLGGTPEAKAYNANIMDEAFANCYQLNTEQKIDRNPFLTGHMFPLTLSAGVVAEENALIETGYTYFDKNNVALVWYYYDLWSFSIIIAVGAVVMIFTSFLNILIGLIKRIFELVLLFLISAPMASLMPLDGGNALKKWRERFVSKAIGVYGPVLGMNVFFIILSLLQTLKLTGIDIIDRVVFLLFVIAGLSMVKDFTNMISELVGGEDTLKSGGDKAKDVGSLAKSVGTKVAAIGGVAGKAIKLTSGVGAAKKVGKVGKAAKNYANAKNALKRTKGSRYAKGSQSYNNAVENMADGIDLGEDGGVSAVASIEGYGEEKFMWMANHKNMSEEQWSTIAEKLGFDKNIENNKENQKKIWNKLSPEQKQKFAESAAKSELADLDSEEEKRKRVAEYKLNSMDWRDRKGIIDANFRHKDQQNRIRNRAIAAAGGLEEYRSLSDAQRSELFNQSKHGNFDNKITRGIDKLEEKLIDPGMRRDARAERRAERSAERAATKMELRAEKIEIGKEASKGLADAFKEYGKQCGSFVQHMLDGLSGNLGEGMKGTTDSMLSAFQGKLKKEIGLQDEKKNQKKIISAQRKASDELEEKDSRRREKEPKVEKKAEKQQVDLSSSTLKDFEKAIRSANEASANKTAQTMSQLKTSLDNLANEIKNSNNKKD